MTNLSFKHIKDSVGNESIVIFETGKFEQPIVILNAYALTKIMSKLKNNSELLDAVNSMYSDITVEFKK